MDPRPAGQLEPDPRCLTDRSREARGEAHRLEDRERDPRPPGERRQPAEPIGNVAGLGDGAMLAPVESLREVDHQQVDRPSGQQRAGDRDPLVDVGGRHDDEPLGPDAPGHRLDRVEGLGEVQPGDDRARGLGLRGEAEREGRPAARQVAPEGHAHASRQAAGPEDPIQRREAGREDPRRIGGRAQPDSDLGRLVRRLERHGRERADDLAESRGSGRAPPRPEGRQGRRHVRGKRCHGPIIEHLFE